jgi:hypothetical protein
MLMRNPELRILITSAEAPNTRQWLNEIRGHFESNARFRELWGNWVPKKSKDRETNWTATSIKLSSEVCHRMTSAPSVGTSSLGSSRVGQHYDFGIPDDLMNEKTVSTRENIRKVEDYVKMLTPIIDPPDGSEAEHGPLKEVGTRWGLDDLYGRQMSTDKKLLRIGEKPRFKTFVRKYKDRDGLLFFPTVFTAKFLERLRTEERMTEYQISCQYFNDPQPEGSRVFKFNSFGFWNANGRTLTPTEMDLYGSAVRAMPSPLGSFTRTNATLDPASTDNDDSDYSAIVVISLDAQRRRFIQEVRREKWTQSSQMIDNIFEAHFRYNVDWWGVEAVGFQAFLKEGFKEAFKKKKVIIPIEGLTHNNTKKEIRIRGIEPFVTDGGMFFKLPDDVRVEEYVKSHPRWGWNYDREALYNLVASDADDPHGEGMHAMIGELLDFPTAATRDCADALAYHVPRFKFVQDENEVKTTDYMTLEWWKRQMKTGF